MHLKLTVLAAMAGSLISLQAGATGEATCDSGPKEGWQKPLKLGLKLRGEGWDVRSVKEDGGCYEVYALNEEGERVEAYFHPVTFEPVPVEEDASEADPVVAEPTASAPSEEASSEPVPGEQQD